MLKITAKSVARLNKLLTTNIRALTMSAQRTQKALEELEKNPYFEKYAEKIAKLQQTSAEEFVERIEKQMKLKEKKQEATTERQFSHLLRPKKSLDATDEVGTDSLDKIMKIDLIKDKEVDEIKEIWLKYHMQKDTIAAIISAGDYDKIYTQSLKTPTFLFPLPRTQGYEFMMTQFLNNTIHFTPLICYQVHKENSPECLKIINYTELKESKGIVLMHGEFDKTAINAKEAQCLANQLQLYYNQKDPEKLKLLESFTNEPDKFSHMDLVKNIEMFSLQ